MMTIFLYCGVILFFVFYYSMFFAVMPEVSESAYIFFTILVDGDSLITVSFFEHPAKR